MNRKIEGGYFELVDNTEKKYNIVCLSDRANYNYEFYKSFIRYVMDQTQHQVLFTKITNSLNDPELDECGYIKDEMYFEKLRTQYINQLTQQTNRI